MKIVTKLQAALFSGASGTLRVCHRMTTKIKVFWKVTPCLLLNIYQSTRRNIPEESNNGGTIFLGRFAKLRKATVILNRSLRFLNSVLWYVIGFFSDITLPTAPWPWGRPSPYWKWVLGTFPGDKGVRCVRLTILPPSCAECLENLGSSTSWNPLGHIGPVTGLLFDIHF